LLLSGEEFEVSANTSVSLTAQESDIDFVAEHSNAAGLRQPSILVDASGQFAALQLRRAFDMLIGVTRCAMSTA
jgi:hypothetical protein